MKKIFLITAAIAAIALTAAFSSCAEDGGAADITEQITESTEAVTTSEVTETTMETVMTTTIACFEEEETEEEVQEPAEEYVHVSADTEFIDYEFIEDYRGTADIGDLADKAVEFLMTTEEYADAMSKIDEIDEEFGEPYIADGKIVPQFETAYPDDYDGDGSTETFIILKMPMRNTYSMLHSFFIFADSGGNMTLLDNISGAYDTLFLNYGKYKQITFGGSGTAGAEDHIVLYGIADGKVKEMYSGRGSFAKEDCFLSFFGWQGMGGFMYFDAAAMEYVGIDGVTVPKETIREMDADNVLADYYGDGVLPEPFKLVGGKYYLAAVSVMDWGSVYVYEDGKFVNLPDSKVRNNNSEPEIRTVTDIDIEQTLANMKPVEN